MAGMGSSTADPSNFVRNPPSVVVKVTGTSREDLNGQLGIVVSYHEDRARYLVHMTNPSRGIAQTMLFKSENLNKASTMEQYQAYWQQLRNDPRVSQEIRRYYQRLEQSLPPSVKPEHVGIGIVVAILLAMYFIGFSRTLMLLSLTLFLMIIAGPDLGSDWRIVARNFPSRARQTMEEQFPFLRGKLTDRVALGIVIVMVLSCLYVLRPRGAAPIPTVDMAARQLGGSLSAEEAYKLGFDDATAGRAFSSSLPRDDADDPGFMRRMSEDEFLPPPLEEAKKSKFGIGTLVAGFVLVRTMMDLGKDAGGQWNFEIFKANLYTLETWRWGMLGFSLFNVLRAFF